MSLGCRVFLYEAVPIKWPPVLHGVYHLYVKRTDSALLNGKFTCEASTFNEARDKFFDVHPYLKNYTKEIVLDKVTRIARNEHA